MAGIVEPGARKRLARMRVRERKKALRAEFKARLAAAVDEQARVRLQRELEARMEEAEEEELGRPGDGSGVIE